MFNSYAAWAMAGFTVNQRKAGVFRDLVSVNRVLEVRVNFVVGVTACHAIFVADVVGVKIANQHSLVIPDRSNRLRRT